MEKSNKLDFIRERIIYFADNSGDRRIDFLANTGLKKGIFDPKDIERAVGSDKLSNILDYYSNLNSEWLLTGKGSMLKDAEPPKSSTESEVENKYIGYYYPNVDASAGLLFETNNDELEKIPVSIPYWGESLKFINVFGDSMYPKFQSGEIIGIKEVEFVYLTFGNTYVVVLQNGDVHLKYVKMGKDENHVILASENKFYEDREFHVKHIRTFYQVKGVISRLAM